MNIKIPRALIPKETKKNGVRSTFSPVQNGNKTLMMQVVVRMRGKGLSLGRGIK